MDKGYGRRRTAALHTQGRGFFFFFFSTYIVLFALLYHQKEEMVYYSSCKVRSLVG